MRNKTPIRSYIQSKYNIHTTFLIHSLLLRPRLSHFLFIHTWFVCAGVLFITMYMSKISIFVLFYKPLTLLLIYKNKYCHLEYYFQEITQNKFIFIFKTHYYFFLLLWKCSEISVWWKNPEWQPQILCSPPVHIG